MEYLQKIDGAKREDKERYNPATAFPSVEIVDQLPLLPLKKAIELLVLKTQAISEEEKIRKMDDLLTDYSNKTNTCDSVMALFALYCSRFVSQVFYQELLIFLALYRTVLNDKGWERQKKECDTDYSKPDSSEVYCETQSAEFVPDISNTFILDYFPEIGSTDSIVKQPESLKFLGVDEKRLSWVILLIKQFCHWLFINKFTEGKVEVKKDNL